MDQPYQVTKLTALPTTLQANFVYFIAPPSRPDYVEIYVTTSTGEVKRVIDENDVQALITTALMAQDVSMLEFADDITARDALTLTVNTFVYVADASGDATVDAGGATYFYRLATDTFIKTGEAESQDIVLAWGNITGRPTSTPAQIDQAVSSSHSHANKTQIDLIGSDANGNLTYDGQLPLTRWDAVGW